MAASESGAASRGKQLKTGEFAPATARERERGRADRTQLVLHARVHVPRLPQHDAIVRRDPR